MPQHQPYKNPPYQDVINQNQLVYIEEYGRGNQLESYGDWNDNYIIDEYMWINIIKEDIKGEERDMVI